MPSFSVANWDKFQHADTFKKSDGTPPWIKLHQTILDKPEMEMLTDAELGFLVRIWLWAARLGNVLPDEYSWWRRRFNRDCTQSLARLIDLGLIEGGPLRKKPRKTRQTVATKTRPDKSRPEETKNRTVGPSASTEDVGNVVELGARRRTDYRGIEEWDPGTRDVLAELLERRNG